ncbi:hypothetical protein [Paenibacillus macerans]|uniref:hypothetical protein n=1 Tax=Paenibacillus macerans TaxID=44252 RepID=UPI002041973B|nr:hypothetical protein [Paenibacillus macerans]MCM3703196.1 hypothetical protein [Paenibacillus macerans]
MILNEQQYLWLCELTGTGLLTSQHSGSVKEIARGLQPSLADRGLGDLAEAILESVHLADLELLGQGGERGAEWVLFADQAHRQGVITVSDPKASEDDDTYSFPLDGVVHKLREVLVPGIKHVFTGLGQRGWHAALLAEALEAEAVVFGAPAMEELPGKAVNFVGEDDPVGDHTRKVVFVKQAEELSEDDEAFLYRKLVFEESGKAVVSGQSEFSRFVSWFYNTAGTVEPEVWKIFFPGSEEEEATLLADLGVYSVFMKVGELNKEKLLHAIDTTVRYAAGQLEAGRDQLAAELDKLPDENYETLVSEKAEKYAMKATDFVMRIFESVQTVLMGVTLFTLEQETFDMDTPIDSFRTQIYDLLDQELERVKACLDQAIARRLENSFQIPDFGFEW